MRLCSNGIGTRGFRGCLGRALCFRPQAGLFRSDLDAKLTYRLMRDVLWIPAQWRRTGGYTAEQVVDGFLRILFDGIVAREPGSPQD